MDLSTLGAIVTVLYMLIVFAIHKISNWYFCVSPSPTLDYLLTCYHYYTNTKE